MHLYILYIGLGFIALYLAYFALWLFLGKYGPRPLRMRPTSLWTAFKRFSRGADSTGSMSTSPPAFILAGGIAFVIIFLVDTFNFYPYMSWWLELFSTEPK